MEPNKCNEEWKHMVKSLNDDYDYMSTPRGMSVKEVIGGKYKMPMPAYLNLSKRKLNYAFMFAEAAWIVSGSNKLSELTTTMKSYANYSDDSVFLSGAYGPKIVDQLTYIVKTLTSDTDSRQAVLNIWRERPGSSKDIPCTTNMQFLIRDDKLHSVVTMRSNDAVLGVSYDIFTFSMVANAVRLLLSARGVNVTLGDLRVNAGSLHIYERHFSKVDEWVNDDGTDEAVAIDIINIMKLATTYEDLIGYLNAAASKWSK